MAQLTRGADLLDAAGATLLLENAPIDRFHALEIVHRIVGYPLAFVIGPIALASFDGAKGHRWTGRAYAVIMSFLYVTGTTLAVSRHPWDTWVFGRNIAFNLLGYSLLFLGWRAMWLSRRAAPRRRTALDTGLFAWLAVLVAFTCVMAATRASAPIRVFAAIGITLLVLEARDWRNTELDRATLRLRHIRYMIGSYMYVLTVVSLVHLRDEMSSDLRWLWPSAMGVLAVVAMSLSTTSRRWVMRTMLAVSLGFGAYVTWEVIRDHGQVERVLGMMPLAREHGDVV